MLFQCPTNQEEEQAWEEAEEHTYWGKHKGKPINNIQLKAWTQMSFLVLHIQIHHIHHFQPDDRQHSGKKDEET